MTYSIIQVSTNGYDKVYDCGDYESSLNLLFTDNQFNVKNWKINKIESNKEFPFDDVFNIRWNPFNYTNTDYIVWIDASIKINASIKKYIEQMINTNSDFATLIHPFRDNIKSEYFEWCRIRNYDKIKAFNWMARMEENGWNPDNKGLYQVNVCIFKNTNRVKEFCNSILKELHCFNGEHLERLDQTIVTYMLKTKFNDLKILELNEKIYKNTKELIFHNYNHPKK